MDKPVGVSSHDVVAAARRATGESRIGHGGTLDPFASGLLVLLLGRATRLLQYLHDTPKEYDAIVTFGRETDTEDHLGVVVREAPTPSRESLERALPEFIGTIQQTPPAYSAKRVDGQRAYRLARAGHEVNLEPVAVQVDALTLSEFEREPDGTVGQCGMHVACGGGTYIRSLARDLARAVGSAAHLSALRRTRVGRFAIEDAVTLAAVQQGEPTIRPAIDACAGYPLQTLDHDAVARVVRGIDVAATVEGPFAALVDDRGTLVAFAERRPGPTGERFQPRAVMREVPVS